MACQCQMQGQGEAGSLIPFDFQQHLMTAGNESLMFFIQGVKVGMQVRASEQAKWTRIAVIASLTFGLITWMKSNR